MRCWHFNWRFFSLLIISIHWIRINAPTAGLGFADTSFSVDVAENCAGNTIIKTLLLTNKPGLNFPLQCTIDSGDDNGHFEITENRNRDCELLTRGQQLDFETKNTYQLTVRLHTVSSIIDPSRSVARITVNVKDVNDNRPTFIGLMYNDIYLAVVAKNAPAHTQIITIQAQDRDSEENGRIQYILKEINEFPEFLKINAETGVVHNVRTFENALEGSIRANVTARDRPGDPTEFLSSTALLIVNLLDDHHRIVLILSTTSPDNAVEMKSQITDFLHERSGFIIGIEKVDVRRLASANATTLDSRGSDITFYAVDPVTYRLVSTEEPQMQSLFFSLEGKYSLLSAISNGLHIDAIAIRHPYPSTWSAGVLYAAKTMEEAVDGFQAALLALSSIVAVLGVAAIVYLCFLWSRYETFRSNLQDMIGSPHLEPVLIEPSLKEYETQVLCMNVNGDDYLGTIKGPPSPSLMHALNASGYSEESSTDSLQQMQAYGSREELECDDVNALMVPALNPIYQSSDENSPQH